MAKQKWTRQRVGKTAAIVVIINALEPLVRYGLFYALFKPWYQRPYVPTDERVDGKIAVITGGNSGIGLETAKELSRRGADIVLLCRNEESGKEAVETIKGETGGKVVLHKLDLANLDSVRECGATLNQELSRIDILINNAGVLSSRRLTSDNIEMNFGVNFLGHFLLTSQLLPLLLQADRPSRIIFLASHVYRYTWIFDDGRLPWNLLADYPNWTGGRWTNMLYTYIYSKIAVLMFGYELTRRLRDTNISVYAVHPGIVDTSLHLKDGWIPWIIKPIYRASLFAFRTPRNGANTSVFCAVSGDLTQQNGFYYKDCASRQLTGFITDQKEAEDLWTFSENLIREPFYKIPST